MAPCGLFSVGCHIHWLASDRLSIIKPLVRKAGARQRLAQVTLTLMVWYPVAPFGSVWCTTAVWV